MKTSLKLILVSFLILLSQVKSDFIDYDVSFNCNSGDYPSFNRDDLTEKALDDLKLHKIDAYIFLIISPFALLGSIFIIVSFIKYPVLRTPPGDLILGICLSEITLLIHWSIHSIQFFHSNNPPKNGSNFCKVSGIVGLAAGSTEFCYNCSFSLYLIFKVRNILKQSKIPHWTFHILTFIASALFLFGIIYLDDVGKNLFGTCSLRAISLLPIGTPIIVLLYVFVSFTALIYFNSNVPDDDPRFELPRKQFLNYYYIYNTSCLIIWSFTAIFYMLAFFNCYYFQKNNLSFVITLGNISKLGTPFILTLIRLQQPFVKKKLCEFLKKHCICIKNYIPDNEDQIENDDSQIGRQPLIESIDIEQNPNNLYYSSFTTLEINLKIKVTQSIVVAIIYDYNKNFGINNLNNLRSSELNNNMALEVKIYNIDNEIVEKTYPQILESLSKDSKIFQVNLTKYAPNIFMHFYFEECKESNIGNSFDILKNTDEIKKTSGNVGGGRRRGIFFLFI